jgi:hypothetical protein
MEVHVLILVISLRTDYDHDIVAVGPGYENFVVDLSPKFKIMTSFEPLCAHKV